MRRGSVGTAALVSLGAMQFAALGGEPHGPPIGDNRFAAEIRTIAGEPDVDDYVAPMLAGDRLMLDLAAGKGSVLTPSLVLIDPDGAAVDPAPRASRGGKRLSVKAFTATKTGTWAVRVAGDAATEGSYSIRFHVTPVRAPRPATLHLGGADPLVASREIDALAGSTMSLRTRSRGKGPPVTVRAVTGPDGSAVFVPASKVVVKGGVVSVRDLTLPATGRYRIDLGIDAGDATASVALAATPPKRPTGTTTLSDPEPALEVRSFPLDGAAGAVVRIRGSGFAVTSPRAAIWIGDAPAMVTEIGAAGTYIDVVVPDAPDDAVADVTVQNPDGQASTRPAWFHYLAIGPLDVRAVEPARLRIPPGASRQFTLRLTRPAKPPGIDVPLVATGGLGTLPSTVHVPGNSTSATFTLLAAATLTTGEVQASWTRTVSSDVDIVPPGTVADLQPTNVTFSAGTTRTMTLTLSSPAPTDGTDVALSVLGPIGTVPASVHVAGGATSVSFEIGTALTDDVVNGTVRASQGPSTFVEALLRVMSPTVLELSGWTVVQRDIYPQVTTRMFQIPDGTFVHEGGTIVIGRNATRSAFVSYWWGWALPGPTPFDSTAGYLDSGGVLPVLDGWETYELWDQDGAVVDGPSIQADTGWRYLRTPGGPAGLHSSWQVVPAAAGNYLPGSGASHATPTAGVYVSKFSDAFAVNGQAVDPRFQCVEIYFDRR